jgi:hypothetical protein
LPQLKSELPRATKLTVREKSGGRSVHGAAASTAATRGFQQVSANIRTIVARLLADAADTADSTAANTAAAAIGAVQASPTLEPTSPTTRNPSLPAESALRANAQVEKEEAGTAILDK